MSSSLTWSRRLRSLRARSALYGVPAMLAQRERSTRAKSQSPLRSGAMSEPALRPAAVPIGEHGPGAVRAAVIALARDGLLDIRETPSGLEARLPH